MRASQRGRGGQWRGRDLFLSLRGRAARRGPLPATLLRRPFRRSFGMDPHDGSDGRTDLEHACIIEVRDPANFAMLDPIERLALEMLEAGTEPQQIPESQNEGARIETMTDDQMYLLLGLGDDDERARMAAQADATQEGDAHVGSVEGAPSLANVVLGGTVEEGIEGAAIPVDDLVPLERMIIYDKDKPQIKLGSMFPSMNEFRQLAMIRGESTSSQATITSTPAAGKASPIKLISKKRKRT